MSERASERESEESENDKETERRERRETRERRERREKMRRRARELSMRSWQIATFPELRGSEVPGLRVSLLDSSETFTSL